MLRTFCLAIALTLARLTSEACAQDRPASKQEPSKAPAPEVREPTVAVKEAPPVRIAFVEHQGPYWTLGPVFERVREAMAGMNEDGPMFVRFRGDPRKVVAADLKSDVGFVVDGGAQAPSLLTVDRRPPEKVAYLLAPGPHGTTSRFYDILYRWAKDNGYEAKGAPFEVYWGRDERSVVEIQLPIVQSGGTAAESRDDSPGPPKPDETVEPAGPSDQGMESLPSPPIDSDETGATHEPEAPESPPSEAADPTAKAVDRIAQLFAAGDSTGLAREVLPDDLLLNERDQAWVGQMAYRLLAIGRGLRQKYGDDGKRVHDLAEALLERYRSVLPEHTDPLAAASRVSSQSLERRQRDLLRRADLLLGRMALGALDLQAVEREVVEMLQELTLALRDNER